MVISRFSVKLERLGAHQLELLRYWRNNEYIVRYMDYKAHITKEMQQAWFEKVNNKNHFYFMIAHKGTTVGLINTSRINWAEKTGDTGLFIWDDKYINSPVPVYASMCMLDVFFKFIGLKTVTAKVKNDNVRAINYNEALGFILWEPIAGSDFSIYGLSSDRYFQHAQKLRQSAIRLFGDETLIELSDRDDTDIFIQGVLTANKSANDISLVIRNQY